MHPFMIHSVELSSHCNFKCSYCPNPYGLPYGHGNMTPETFDRVCHWVKILNPVGKPKSETTWLQGFGEPLLNPHIMGFVTKISPLTSVGFSTNGALLTEEKIRQLDRAGLGYLVVSNHDPAVASRAFNMIRAIRPRFRSGCQMNFNDDFAGQVKNPSPNAPPAYFHCTYAEQGSLHVLWDGRIPNCCTDAKGYPILASVYDEEIRHIETGMIPLCRKCRSAHYLIPEALARYSPSLKRSEREAMLWRDVERDTRSRHREGLDNARMTPLVQIKIRTENGS